MVGNDKKWKSLWDTSAMLLLLGGPALLFAAFCIYAFTHVVNLQIAIAGALAFLIGILMMCFPAYEGKESLSGLAGLGKSAAHNVFGSCPSCRTYRLHGAYAYQRTR